MPDENNIINALHKPYLQTRARLKARIRELEKQVVVATATNEEAELYYPVLTQQLHQRINDLTEHNFNLVRQLSDISNEVRQAQRWAKAWKNAAKLRRTVSQDLGREVDRLRGRETR